MRQGQQNRRGRGRSSGGGHSHGGHSNNHSGNSNNNSNNNRKGQNPLTRSFESTGPDVKIRGNPAHIAEKYMQLARDAQTSGDPVLAENYLQHAEHYNRIILTYREQQAAEAAGGAPVPSQAGVMPRSRFQSDDDQSEDGDEPSQGDASAQIRGQEPQPGLYEGGAAPRAERPDRQNERQNDREPRPDRQERPDRGGQDRGNQDRGNRDFPPREARDGNRDRPVRDDRGPRDDRPYRDDRPRNFDDRPQRRPENGQQGQVRPPQDRPPQDRNRERFGEQRDRGFNSGQDRGPERSPDRPDRPQRFDRPERGDRPERIDRGNRFERPERSERYDRHADAAPPQPAPDAAPRPEMAERPVVERAVDTYVPPAPVLTPAVVEAQPSLPLSDTAAPAPRAAPRRRAPAANRFAENTGGEAPEFLTRPVRRPRREAPVADAADAPAAPVEKPVTE
jgi:hypothetical protein